MKKFIAIIVAIMCAFPMFAFVGCTDKTRELTTIEKQLVGDWGTPNGRNLGYTFNADGTFINQQSDKKTKGTFKATGNDSIYLVELKRENGEKYINFYYRTDEPDKLFYDTRFDMYYERY